MPALLMLRGLLTATAVMLALVAFGSEADAQASAYSCGKGRTITLTVTGKNTISAYPIEDNSMELRRSQENPMLFTYGDYSVEMSPDRSRIKVEIADFGTLNCTAQQASAPSAGCEEGQAMVKGRCRPVAQSSCPAGTVPVPETDNCVPARGGDSGGGSSGGGSVREMAQPFLGTWYQDKSNAGDCDNCSIDLSLVGGNINVRANNGWSARVVPGLDGPNYAEGIGRWPRSTGGVYAGAQFRLELTLSRGRLSMTMTVDTNDGQTSVVKAKFSR